jgi:hypothetical protein
VAVPFGLLVFFFAAAWVGAAFAVARAAARKGHSYGLWFFCALVVSPLWSAIHVSRMASRSEHGGNPRLHKGGSLYKSDADIVADIDAALADGVAVGDIQRHWSSLRASNEITYRQLAIALAHLGMPAEVQFSAEAPDQEDR